MMRFIWLLFSCFAGVVGCSGGKQADAYRPNDSTISTNFTIPYLPLSIFYELPGDRSKLVYGTENSLGTDSLWTLTKSDGTSLAIEVEQDTTGAGLYVMESAHGEITSHKRDGTSVGYATNDGSDVPDHGRDQYRLLLAIPALEIDRGDGRPVARIDSSAATFETISAAELEMLATEPRNDSNLSLTASRVAAFVLPRAARDLLALDPFISGESLDANPARFAPTEPTEIQLAGPDRAGDSLLLVSQTITAGNGGAVTNSPSDPLFTLTLSGLDGIDAALTLAYRAQAPSTQASASAALLTIGTDSLCTRGAVHPYLDKALGAYLATPDFFDQCQ
jgi:hypothetical protein